MSPSGPGQISPQVCIPAILIPTRHSHWGLAGESVHFWSEWTRLAHGIKRTKKIYQVVTIYLFIYSSKYMLQHVSKFLNCSIGPSVCWNFLFMCILQSYVMETFCFSCESVIFKKSLVSSAFCIRELFLLAFCELMLLLSVLIIADLYA